MTTELEFAKSYLQLIEMTADPSKVSEFSFEQLSNLPPLFTFPPLAHPYIECANQDNSNNNTNNEADDNEISIDVDYNFKSLRQPKFNLSIQIPIKSTTLIFSIKQLLAQHLKVNNDILVDPVDIKLMLRTKTLQDSDKAIELGMEKISLNVLVSKFTNKTQEDDEQNLQQKQPVTSEEKQISENTWSQIKDLIMSDLKNEETANSVLLKFKNCI